MEPQHGVSKIKDLFLEEVAEQIQYKPIREEIKEELEAHIEDRKIEYVEQGLEDSKAWYKAVINMGDAVEIGVSLNEVRKVQRNWMTVLLVMGLFVIGLLGNIRLGVINDNGISFINIFFHLLLGLSVFSIVYYFGYQKVIKYHHIIFLTFIGLYFGIWRFYECGYIFLVKPISHSMIFTFELLNIPVIASILYRNRNKKYIPFLLVIVLITTITGINSILLAHLILIIAAFSILLYMIVKRMIIGKIRFQLPAWIVSLGIVFTIFIITFNGDWKYEFEQCFSPQIVAHNYFDDSYNSILMKNLLGKAEKVGTIELSQDELLKYYTSEWYFSNITDDRLKYKMKGIEIGNVTLEEILPQHYQTNYRIAYWILKYGWIPSFVLLGFIVTFFGMLIRMVILIKNKMGKVLAFSCTLTLILQSIPYLMGNFGYQYDEFCNLPFISQGICSIVTNMVLVGLACSAYRYDRVVNEEKWNKKSES